MARIEIWTRDVIGTQFAGPYAPQHTFFIKVNDDGTREILRGGPVADNMLVGNVQIINSAYSAQSLDWYDPSLPNDLHFQGQEVKFGTQAEIDAKWQAAVNLAQIINQQNYDYEISGQNCNTVTGHLANAMGLIDEVKDFISTKNLNTPGFDDLFIEGILDQTYDSFKDAIFGMTQNFIESIITDFTSLITPNPVSNILFGNQNQDNIMLGKEGQQNTFYIPNLDHNFSIIDPDGNGQIVIGNGSQSVLLQGNAIPKKDPLTGEIIPGQWTLNGYDLIRSGNNLVIIPAGGDPASQDTPRITINNFPFNAQGLAFGFTLGKKIIHNEFDALELVKPEIISRIFATTDRRGRFFSLTKDSSKGFCLTNYDGQGNNLGSQSFSNYKVNGIYNIWSYADSSDFVEGKWVLKNEQLLIPFQASKGFQADGNQELVLGIARIDVDSGKIVSSRTTAGWTFNSDISIRFNRGGISSYGTDLALNYEVYYTNYAGDPEIKDVKKYLVQKFDKQSLSQIGADAFFYEPPYSGNVVGLDIPSPPNPFRLLTQQQVDLANGGKAFLQPSVSDTDLALHIPKLRDMTAQEVPANAVIAPGADVETAAGLQQGILTFQEAVNAQVEATLKITPVPNSRLVINGAIGDIDLSEFHLTEEEIAQHISEVKSDQYSMSDLLAGSYNPSGINRRSIENPDKILARLGISKTEFEEWDRVRREEETTTAEPSAEETEQALSDNPEVFSVLSLPQNQQLIFPGISEETLLERMPDYFIGFISNQLPSTTTSLNYNTTFAPTLFTSTSAISSTTPPQIGNGSSTNPLALGSAGFIALTTGAAIIATGGLGYVAYKAYNSEIGQRFRTSLANGIGTIGNFLNPQNWFRSRVTPQNEIPLERITTNESTTDPIVENPIFDSDSEEEVIHNPLHAEYEKSETAGYEADSETSSKSSPASESPSTSPSTNRKAIRLKENICTATAS